jgi:hypothetical protein
MSAWWPSTALFTEEKDGASSSALQESAAAALSFATVAKVVRTAVNVSSVPPVDAPIVKPSVATGSTEPVPSQMSSAVGSASAEPKPSLAAPSKKGESLRMTLALESTCAEPKTPSSAVDPEQQALPHSLASAYRRSSKLLMNTEVALLTGSMATTECESPVLLGTCGVAGMVGVCREEMRERVRAIEE